MKVPEWAVEDKEKVMADIRKLTGDDAEFHKKWAPDELKFITSDFEAKVGLSKKLFAERLQKISLRKSKYSCRPLVFFFRYPTLIMDLYSSIGKHSVKEGFGEDELDSRGLGVSLRIPDKQEVIKMHVGNLLSVYSVPIAKVARVYSTMKDIMKSNGFVLTRSQKYNFCWGFSKHRAQLKFLTPLQRFSHFQGCWQVGRKDFLWQNVQNKRQKFPHLLSFMPLTYCLKYEYEDFLVNRHISDYWIIKPVDAARGEGIFVIGSSEEVKQQKGIILV